MKITLLVCSFFLFCMSTSFAQMGHNEDGSGSVLVDNEKVEVVEYVGEPNKDVCGLGNHHHDAHLTVALTDAKVLITPEEGEQTSAEIPAGAAIWFKEGTHSATNDGDKPTKFLLVYLKNQ